MYHDKKTALQHQDILVRRGFGAVPNEVKGKSTKAKAEIVEPTVSVESPEPKSVNSNNKKSVKSKISNG